MGRSHKAGSEDRTFSSVWFAVEELAQEEENRGEGGANLKMAAPRAAGAA